MKLYDLDLIPWLDSQLLYHSLARLGREGLILCRPSSPYVCIGRHQDLGQEVDTDYCARQGIPTFRREVGGGGVYLDGNQLFYQLVISERSPLVPPDRLEFYRRFLAPVMDTYRTVGVPATYKPVNDLMAGGRKVSGNGVAQINGMVVFVGNVIADFDYETMARVLKVPDEKYRDKVHRTLRDNLSTLRRELGASPGMPALRAVLAHHFGKLLGRLEPAPVDDAWAAAARGLAPEMLADDWLWRQGRRRRDHEVRISAATTVRQGAWKAPGGLIRATTEISDGRLVSVELSGDFFVEPAEALHELEASLEGLPIPEVPAAIALFMGNGRAAMPGVSAADLSRTILGF